MKSKIEKTAASLVLKLELVGHGQPQELTAAEATVYGIQYSDLIPDGEQIGEEYHEK